MTRTAGLVLFAVLTGCAGEPRENPAMKAVEQLYRVRIEGRMSGAPSGDELAKMAPYLSKELQGLLPAAANLRDVEARAHPDEKPPFVEGDLFTSLFEGPTAVERMAGLNPANASKLRLRVEFTNNSADPPSLWSDYVIVTQEGERWVVSDVEYAGSWDFANKGSLVESLKAGLR